MREKAIFWLGQRHSVENAQFLKDLFAKVENDDLKDKIISPSRKWVARIIIAGSWISP